MKDLASEIQVIRGCQLHIICRNICSKLDHNVFCSWIKMNSRSTESEEAWLPFVFCIKPSDQEPWKEWSSDQAKLIHDQILISLQIMQMLVWVTSNDWALQPFLTKDIRSSGLNARQWLTLGRDKLSDDGGGTATLLLETDLRDNDVFFQHWAAVGAHSIPPPSVVLDLRTPTVGAHRRFRHGGGGRRQESRCFVFYLMTTAWVAYIPRLQTLCGTWDHQVRTYAEKKGVAAVAANSQNS